MDDKRENWDILATEYLADLLAGRVEAAKARMRNAVERPHDLRLAYLDVFQPVQGQVTELLQAGRLIHAEAHLMTMVAQELIEEFSSLIFHRPSLGIAALISTLPGELRDLEPRMIADFLEMEGVDTTFVSSPSGVREIVEWLRTGSYDFFVLAAASSNSVAAAEELLDAVCALGLRLPILVGGAGFQHDSNHQRSFGDYARFANAEDAVEVAKVLVGFE